MAPEILTNESYDSKVDIYSLGVVLYQLIFGNLPFNGVSFENQLFLIKE